MTFAEAQALERKLTQDFAEGLGVELDDAVVSASAEDIMAAGMAKAWQAEEDEAGRRTTRRPKSRTAREQVTRAIY